MNEALWEDLAGGRPLTIGEGESLAIFAKAQDVFAHLPAARLALPEDEDARIARYKNEADRQPRRAAHGLVRHLIGLQLSRAPDSLVFTRDEKGRPSLPDAAGLDFNLSHSGIWIAVGIARGGRIGVDVEEANGRFAWENVARAYLHEDEYAALSAMTPDVAAREALKLWCLKEAVLKATGEGISVAPHALAPRRGQGCWSLERAGVLWRADAWHFAGGAAAVATDLPTLPRVIRL